MESIAAVRTQTDTSPHLKLVQMGLGLTLGSAMAVFAALGQAKAESPKSHAFLVAKMATTAPAGAVQMCDTFQWACATSKRAAPLTAKQMKSIKKINLNINRRVSEVSDAKQYGREEYWALPTSFGGDCEDFALLKKRELIKAGIPAQKLLIATVLDKRRQAHAVLVLRTAQGDYVLDNLTNKIKHWDRTGYVFLRLQNADSPSKWSAILSIASKSA